MIYLVSGQTSLFEYEEFTQITLDESLNMLHSWDVIQYDSETTGRDPHICDILCIQFGNKSANAQIVVDTTTINIQLYKSIFNSGKLFIGQNLKFDLQFLYSKGIVVKNVWDTMIIEQFLHLGYDNKYFHYSLKAIAERRLHIDIDKTTRGEIIWRGLDTKVILYAAGDVMYLEDIKEQQELEIKTKGGKLGSQLENSFVPVIAYLEWCGIRLDENKWKLKMQDNERKKEIALEALNNFCVNYCSEHENSITTSHWVKESENNHGVITWFPIESKYKKWTKSSDFREEISDYGTITKYRRLYKTINFTERNTQGDLFSGFDTEAKCAINWSSSAQVIPFVQYLGFDTTTTDKKTGVEKDSVVEKVLTKQKGINDEFLKVYFSFQEATKECSTYGQNYLDAINPITGRIHTQFKQLGAISGRMSCGNSNQNNSDLAKLKKISPSRCTYVQIQNLPSDTITRSSFVPNTGNLMTSCDYSALESRLGADIYNEPEMLREFLEGSGDIHSLCAKMVFREELADVNVKDIAKVRPDLRKKVKPIEFSQQFGGGAKAVADALGCSKQEAEEFVNAYADGFKGISNFKKIGSEFVRNHGYVVICKKTGHKLYWEDWKKWRDIEDLPEYIYKTEYTAEERREHKLAAARWDRMALNSPTQGTGIICLKLAMIKFFKWILENNLFGEVLICNLVHDEAVVEYPIRLKDIASKKLVDCMESAAASICTKLPIPAVAETGDHWIH